MNTSSTQAFKQQTLVEHLAELRFRLIYSFIGILIVGLICFSYSEFLFEIIRAPIAPYLPNSGLVFTAPMDKFLAHVKIACFGGIIFSCPYWFFQLWKFIAPGMYEHERKYALGFIGSAVLLFLIGVLMCYFMILPVTFEYLMNFGGSIDKPMITIDQYLSFFMTMILIFGISFELPLILIVLGMMGFVSHAFLKDKRRYAVVLLSIFAAIATPSPDALSMLLLLIPMALLYEVAVILVGLFERKRKAKK